MYNIFPYSYQQAKKLGVSIIPSKDNKHKIDVYKGDKYVTSIGDINYKDYPTYIKLKGIKFADERRRLYKLRHGNDNVIGTRGFYASNILW